MSSDSELLAPVTETPPVAADAAPPIVERPVETPAPTDDEPDVIEIPTGEKLVQLSALQASREKTKQVRAELEAAKTELGKSAERDARIQALEQQLQQVAPKAQAYDAAVEAQSRLPQQPQAPTPQQTAKLEKIAKSLDFYKSDGTLDTGRAAEHLELVREEAADIARQQIAPYEQRTTSDQSSLMLQRAMITKTPEGAQPDPDVLRNVWSRLDPALTATPQGAAQAWAVALGHSVATGKLPKAKEAVPDPLVIEKAGGKDTPGEVSLRDSDKRVARDMGITDKEYAAELAKMPAGWGKGQ
jgi:hypothetical protein